ncbi:MAG: DUF3786 domain-containing protein [Deltaproteobacteria bacterium]|nr:DUF3786 domain-containing protein [Deltaproteobacteria bacterium]
MTDEKNLEQTFAAYWDKLEGLHPIEVCERTEAVYRYDKNGYFLPFLNQRYLVIPNQRKIMRIRPDETLESEPVSMGFYLMSLFYLTDAKKVQPARRWISEKDLRGGEMFFRGPHALPLTEVTEKYGDDPEAFLEAGKRLGGVKMLYGDMAFGLDVFPKILLVYILWKGDEEFSSRVQVLFDQTIQEHFPLDVIWCAVSEVNRRLVSLKI